MSYIMVDVETDGPIPGDYSMVALGAVVVEPALERTFHGRLRPISERFLPEALAVSGFERAETLAFDAPEAVMAGFAAWVAAHGGKRPIFISDNNGFDWMFVCWYFHRFLGRNPFGHSSQNLGSLYKGLVKDTFATFKHLRRTAHTHHPVDDARGNAEALLHMKRELGLKIALDCVGREPNAIRSSRSREGRAVAGDPAGQSRRGDWRPSPRGRGGPRARPSRYFFFGAGFFAGAAGAAGAAGTSAGTSFADSWAACVARSRSGWASSLRSTLPS
jgi:hypothetical protein